MKQTLSREDRRRAWAVALVIVAVLAAAAAGAWLLRDIRWSGSHVQPSAPDAALMAAAVDLDAIDVALTFDPDAASQLTGVQTLTLTNRTGQTQQSIVLRSYTGAYLSEETSPNASEELFEVSYGGIFSRGGLLVDQACVDDVRVVPLWADDAKTVLVLTPEAPWLPGETRVVTLKWHAAVPALASRFGYDGSVYALGNLFPTPAVWLGDAWDTRAVTAVGDPFMSECANWTVTLDAPKRFMPAASAYAEPTVTGDMAQYRWQAPAMRDFALTLSEHYVRAAARQGRTQVVALAADAERARSLVKYACMALETYAALWGDYAYPTLTLAQVDFPYGGMEYPGLVFIGGDMLRAGSHAAEPAVAHEVAHQWWSVQVGSDSWAQPWQDESLAVYAYTRYLAQRRSADRAAYVSQNLEASMRVTIPGAVTPGSPIDYFSDMDQYSLVVYCRGGAMWMALENLLGEDTLDAALRDYQARYRFRIAGREDLTRILSEHADRDLSALITDYLDTLISN